MPTLPEIPQDDQLLDLVQQDHLRKDNEQKTLALIRLQMVTSL